MIVDYDGVTIEWTAEEYRRLEEMKAKEKKSYGRSKRIPKKREPE